MQLLLHRGSKRNLSNTDHALYCSYISICKTSFSMHFVSFSQTVSFAVALSISCLTCSYVGSQTPRDPGAMKWAQTPYRGAATPGYDITFTTEPSLRALSCLSSPRGSKYFCEIRWTNRTPQHPGARTPSYAGGRTPSHGLSTVPQISLIFFPPSWRVRLEIFTTLSVAVCFSCPSIPYRVLCTSAILSQLEAARHIMAITIPTRVARPTSGPQKRPK